MPETHKEVKLMSNETAENLLMLLIYLVPFLLLLGVGGVVAEYVLPRIPFINRRLESLPDWEDEVE